MARPPTTYNQAAAVLTLMDFLDNKENIRRLRLEEYNIADDAPSDYRGTCSGCGMEQVFWGIDCYVDGVPIADDVLDCIGEPDGDFMAQGCLWSFGWRQLGHGLLCPGCHHEYLCDYAKRQDIFRETD